MPELVAALRELGEGPSGTTRIVGFDLVEVSPLWDPTGRTGVTAAAIVREAILTWWGKGAS